MKKKVLSYSVSLPVDELVPVVQDVLAQGGSFVLTVTGWSMSPTLRHMNDKVELISPNIRYPKVGEIVFFKRSSNVYVLHRIIKERKGKFTVNGDAQDWTETIYANQIIGVVQRIEHRGRWISCDSVCFRIWNRIWRITKPFRPILFKITGKLKRLFHSVQGNNINE